MDSYEGKTVMMLSATAALKPPKVKVAQITSEFTLPRPVELVKMLGVGAGALVALAFVAIAPVPLGMMSVAFALTVGGVLGFAATVYSPMRGANLAQWALLKLRRRSRRVEVDGQRVQLAVGICRVKGMTLGSVHLTPSAVDVLPGSVDERGASTVVVDATTKISPSEGLVDADVSLEDMPVNLDEVPADDTGALGALMSAMRNAASTADTSLTDTVSAARNEADRDAAGFRTPSN